MTLSASRQSPEYRTKFTYDAQNRLLLTILKEKVENGAYTVLQTNSVAYNAIGKQAFTTNALNRVTSYLYDALGNLVETQFPDGTVTRTVYDENNHPWIVQDKAVPVDGVTVGPATCTTYDASGRAIRVERLIGATLAVTTVSNQPSRVVTSTGSSQTTSRTVYDDALVSKLASEKG